MASHNEKRTCRANPPQRLTHSSSLYSPNSQPTHVSMENYMVPGPSTNAMFPKPGPSCCTNAVLPQRDGHTPQHVTQTWKPLSEYEIHLLRQLLTALQKKQSSEQKKHSSEIRVLNTTVNRLQGKVAFLQQRIEKFEDNMTMTNVEFLTGLRAQNEQIGATQERLRKVEYDRELSQKRKRDGN